MNKFYIIRPTSDPDVTGLKKDLVQGEIIREGYSDKEKYDEMYEYFFRKYKWSKIPKFDLDFQHIKLSKKAKLLDFMTFDPIISCGEFLVSAKAQAILKKFNLPPYRLYNATVYQGRKVIEDYKVFYCPWLDYDVINFAKSTFNDNEPSILNPYVNQVKIINKKDFLARQQLHVSNIALNDPKILEYDVLNLRIFPRFFISDNLKKEIIQEEIIGLDIFDCEGLIIEDYEII